ncbi:hypothetical protein ACET3X_002872 [Alternaria dauci]|uniref:AAA+ ATPase domain-containing protein n=1 Tax=Alternaria dauci TaxID=48095 RepID=A0ABR3UR89_9PLEO
MSSGHSSAPSGASTSAPEPKQAYAERDNDMGVAGDAGSEAYDSGSDAMEGVETPSTKEVVIAKTNALDVVQRDLVLAMNKGWYGSETPVANPAPGLAQKPFQTEQFFTLRGRDHPTSTLPEGLSTGKKIKALVMGDALFAGMHMETSLELAKYRDAAADQAGAPTAASTTTGPPKAPKSTTTTPPADTEPPAYECVKVFFHLDTQTPNIEFIVQDPKTDNTMSCRLWAADLHRGDDARVRFNVAKYQPDTEVNRSKPSDEHEHKGLRHLETMSQTFFKTCVMEVSIDLWQPDPRHWEGISPADLADIRAKNAASKTKVYVPPQRRTAQTDEEAAPDTRLETRNNLVKILDEETIIKLYFTCKSTEGAVKQWEKKFAGYMRELLSVTADYGNFWFYKHQLWDHDMQMSIEDPVLASIDWAIPRWLVTQWSFTKTTSAKGTVTWSDPEPHRWSSLEFPQSGYPHPNEAAFLLKLGVLDEQQRQIRDLKELVQSDGTKWFKARFRHFGKTKATYVVEVYLGLESEMADARINLPQPGTRIRFEVDRDTSQKPSKKNVVKFDGVVVYDSLETKASFICVADCQGKALAVADSSAEYNIFVSYLIDKTTSMRMMEGIALLQTSGETHGPDSRGAVLGCRNTASNTDIMKRSLDDMQLSQFEQVISEIQPPSNPVQKEAMLNTCRSASGNVVIIGPSGTGKTATIDKIGHGHAALGHRVMYCAPMNSNVHTLIDKFLEQNEASGETRYADNEWVFVTGGYTSIDKANRLRRDQAAGDADLDKANELLSAYINDAKNRANIPHFERTLGYKVGKQIEIWSADPKYDESEGKGLHTDAKSYLETKAELYHYNDEDQSRAKTYLRALEYTFTIAFLTRVKFLFCTVSTSAHPLVQESGNWDVLIIDEAARESRAGIAVALGTLHGRVKVIVWAGDHKQGTGIITGQDSNVGYKLLARNVFESLAETDRKDEASPCEVITLNTGYRMEQSLMDFSSHWLYNGKITSHPSTGTRDMPLRNTLRKYWAKRLPDDFAGHYTQIGIDVTHNGFASELLNGTTTRLNRYEARQIACTVVDMLNFEVPKVTGGEPCRAILAEDICIIANYTGQILELRKAVKARALEMKLDMNRIRDLWYNTTADVQGKERAITMFSTVLASGNTRLAQKEHLPIGFVADIKNLNVSVTRCTMARYTFGALRLFVQAKRDNHTISRKASNLPFFDYVNRLHSLGAIVAYEDNERWFCDGSKPETSASFRHALQTVASYKPQAAPKTTKSPGNHPGGVSGASKPAGVHKEKRKHRGGKGGTKKHRNGDGNDA